MQQQQQLIYTRAHWDKVVEEILPLAEQHYREIAWRQDQIPLDVDVEKYSLLASQGMLLCFTARERRRLVGYAVFFFMPHMHYRQTKMAVNDVVFLLPQYRSQGSGMALIKYCEVELKALGANVITLHVKPELDWGGLCEYMGYEMGDRVWQKWLGD